MSFKESYIVGIPDIRKMKGFETRSVKVNEEEMYFACNQVHQIAGPTVEVIDEGRHYQEYKTTVN